MASFFEEHLTFETDLWLSFEEGIETSPIVSSKGIGF
jgi:hypothetical protein